MSNTWVFQANPVWFDIDRFLAGSPSCCKWRARQQSDKMEIGDRVFIWRAIGGGERRLSGIVACGELIARAKEEPDDSESAAFWRDPSEAQKIEKRVQIRFVRIALHPHHLLKDELSQDPVLSQMAIVRSFRTTNYLTTTEQADQLLEMWEAN